MSPETLEAFHDTLKKHFKKLKANRDLDNLKVLRNRILTILDNNARKFSDTELKKVSKLRKLLHKMNEDIETMEQEIAEPIELVDVVREVHNKYKPTEKLSDKEKGKYVLVKMKKDTIGAFATGISKTTAISDANWKKIINYFRGARCSREGWYNQTFYRNA